MLGQAFDSHHFTFRRKWNLLKTNVAFALSVKPKLSAIFKEVLKLQLQFWLKTVEIFVAINITSLAANGQKSSFCWLTFEGVIFNQCIITHTANLQQDCSHFLARNQNGQSMTDVRMELLLAATQYTYFQHLRNAKPGYFLVSFIFSVWNHISSATVTNSCNLKHKKAYLDISLWVWLSSRKSINFIRQPNNCPTL